MLRHERKLAHEDAFFSAYIVVADGCFNQYTVEDKDRLSGYIEFALAATKRLGVPQEEEWSGKPLKNTF